MIRDDYQQFSLNDGRVGDVGQRLRDKLAAVQLPDVAGMDVLDVGCDMGFWSFLCAQNGARVVGLDRNRSVKGVPTDLVGLNNLVPDSGCSFFPINVGEQWRTYGRFDLVLLFSLYHHIYAQVEEHEPIWLWLWLQTRGHVLWENPVNDLDRVVQINVPAHLKAGYTQQNILDAAGRYFDAELFGPALHEEHRLVYRFTPKPSVVEILACQRVSGAGGASKAWTHDDGARMREFKHITGHHPIPGSINLILDEPFDWSNGYFRTKMRDVVKRGNGLDVEWAERWVRLYPCFANREHSYIFRFEGESYPENFVEVVSSHVIDGDVSLHMLGQHDGN